MQRSIITLLTDFGLADTYVAQMKGQILTICPQAQLIDITHLVPAQDIAYASQLLFEAAPHFPSQTIHLVIIDPGVGTARNMLAAEVETMTEDDPAPRLQRFVLPDNGLLSPLVRRFGMVGANRLCEPKYWRPGTSHTFHGRDIMGPVAAHWAAGVQRSAFGPACSHVLQIEPAQPKFHGDICEGRIAAVDHFGNVITDIPAAALRNAFPDIVHFHCQFEAGSHAALDAVPLVTTYGQRERGQPVLLAGSSGWLELAVVGGNAAALYGLRRGIAFRLLPAP